MTVDGQLGVINEELDVVDQRLDDIDQELGTVDQKLAEHDEAHVKKTGDRLTGNLILADGVVIEPENALGANLGSIEKPFGDIFIGPNSIYVNGKKVISSTDTTIDVSTDPDQHLAVSTCGLGTTRVASGKEVILYSGDALNIQARVTLLR